MTEGSPHVVFTLLQTNLQNQVLWLQNLLPGSGTAHLVGFGDLSKDTGAEAWVKHEGLENWHLIKSSSYLEEPLRSLLLNQLLKLSPKENSFEKVMFNCLIGTLSSEMLDYMQSAVNDWFTLTSLRPPGEASDSEPHLFPSQKILTAGAPEGHGMVLVDRRSKESPQ